MAMNEAARRKMTADEFYAWVRTKTEVRYELVNGDDGGRHQSA